MKKLIFVFAVMCALPIFTSCIKDKPADDGQTDELVADSDTVVIQEVTGVAVDGAMNSVYLLVGNDTIEFSYPDLDSDVRDSWDINDTLTVKYVETQNGDSVVQVINEALT
mgnify:CR=1 FL=1